MEQLFLSYSAITSWRSHWWEEQVNLGINHSCSEPPAAFWPKLLRLSSTNSKCGCPSRQPYIILNWPVLLELNKCDTRASLLGSMQSCCQQLMVLMSAFGLSAHLHNASLSDMRSKDDDFDTLKIFKGVHIYTFVFMSFGMKSTWDIKSLWVNKSHLYINATMHLLSYGYFWSSNGLREKCVAWIHTAIYWQATNTTVDSNRISLLHFRVHLSVIHKWDFIQRNLRILEQVHGCFWHLDLQFRPNIIASRKLVQLLYE